VNAGELVGTSRGLLWEELHRRSVPNNVGDCYVCAPNTGVPSLVYDSRKKKKLPALWCVFSGPCFFDVTVV